MCAHTATDTRFEDYAAVQLVVCGVPRSVEGRAAEKQTCLEHTLRRKELATT